MTWIRTLEERELESELGELYHRIVDPETKRTDEILMVHSLHPEGLASHFSLYRALMTGTPTLRKVDREMVALVVSVANDCHY